MPDTLMSTYPRLPVTFVRGEGAWLWDTAGKKYLDAFSGVAVCGLGHAHPAVAEALCNQAQQLIHTSNWYGIARQQELADKLTEISGMDNVFFGNSGAEAVECAIKIARMYGHKKDIAVPTIIVMEGSFHGRTLATLTATGSRKVQAGFEPLVAGFVRVPYGDLAAIEIVAKNNHDVVAVLVEPVQGEGGINIPPEDYLPGLRSICDRHQWLLMLDEIQTGMGRTGRWFAFQHHDLKPDVMSVAKGLANGVPIGACLARGAAASMLQVGNHGSTFGGNPLACAAALATIKTLHEQKLATRAASLGARMLHGFSKKLAGQPNVKEIRGKGLMLGIELTHDCRKLTALALERGLLINVTHEKVIRLLPPLVISDAEADQIVDGVSLLVSEFGAA
ncbi:MAG: aspartate aminotransferase family protein [Gammaproteobacteria bacterium]|nr:aspartate aminotransferase family protein [Gammaproteobacteria bacterium]